MKHLATLFSLLVALCLAAPVHAQECVSLAPVNDGSGANGAVGLPDLVISEINPGDYIELYNTTPNSIDLDLSPYWFCSPFAYASMAVVGSGVTVPAKGYHTVPWPVNFTDVDAGGEVILYSSGLFGTSTAILDFICWGTNPHGSRKAQAEAVGKWTGGCAGALTNGAIHRNPETTGTSAADYDVDAAPSPFDDCVPPIVDAVGDSPAFRPLELALSPNPFGSVTRVGFVLEAPTRLDVTVYAVDGSLVKVISSGDFAAGDNVVAWDGTDHNGTKVASGTYLVRVAGRQYLGTTRVTLVR